MTRSRRRGDRRVAGLVAAAGLAGCAVDPTSVDRAAVTGGAPTAGDAAVVAIVVGGHAQCTGTLIAPRVVVTAAHCPLGDETLVLFGTSLDPGAGELSPIAHHRRHPDHATTGALADDVAVLLLARPAPAGVVPATVNRTPLTVTWVGTTVRVVGFGHTSATDTEPHVKREGTATITAVTADELRLGPAPSQPCAGDSGGPAFATVGGTELLVAVTSAGDAECASYSREVRIDVHLAGFVDPYLAETAAGAAGPGERCYYPEHCAAGACFAPPDAPRIAYCAAPCTGAAGCPAAMTCTDGECRHPLPSPGAFGTPCASADACDSAVCATPVGLDEAMCTTRCDPDSALPVLSCADGRDCVPAAEQAAVCVEAPAPGGCNAGTRDSPLGWLVGLASILALRRAQREARRARRARARAVDAPPDDRAAVCSGGPAMGRRLDQGTSEVLSDRTAPVPIGTGLSAVVVGEDLVWAQPLPATGQVTIGRGASADIRIDSTSVSRVHAILTLGDPIRVEDAGSANGTFVRGERLAAGTPTAVAVNDVIELGAVMIVVQRRAATGAPRRVWTQGYFEARVEDECARAQRTRGRFAVCRLRVDGAADGSVERVIAGALRGGDLVGRCGPGDFAVLVVDCTAAEAADVIARAAHQLEAGGRRVDTGMAVFPDDGRLAHQLIATAGQRAGGLGRPVQVRDGEPLAGGGVMGRLVKVAERVARSGLNVLLLGETGVGKEVLAERIHALSARAGRPLVRLSCAAFSEHLLESELFGHEKGAFTGAVQVKPGLFETAAGGSVFLDEIGDMPLPLQPKILRVLEERKVLRLGGLKPRAFDARFIAATNRDLEVEIAAGRFRADLYYRLAGVTLVIPPLRERPDEIEPLARELARRAAAAAALPPPVIDREALDLVQRYSWPGNVRELKNVMERAVVLAGGDPIRAEHLPVDKMQATVAPAPPPAIAPAPAGGSSGPLRADVAEVEKRKIAEVLEQCRGNQTRAAAVLGISRVTLAARMDAFGLPRPRKGNRS